MSSSKKILHLSTGHLGGAGLAARRLNADLYVNGLDSFFLAIENKSYVLEPQELALPRSIIDRARSKFTTFVNQRLSNRVLFSPFSINLLTPEKLHGLGFTAQNTLLHIHNWANLLSERGIRKLLDAGYEIVCTLHDQRILTGGCHYSLNCENYKRACQTCPLIRGSLKVIPLYRYWRNDNLLKSVRNRLTFISPSLWLQEVSLKSPLAEDIMIFHLPNTLGPNWRRKLASFPQIMTEKKEGLLIGVASMDPTNYVKGGDILIELQKLVSQRAPTIEFLFLNSMHGVGDAFTNFWARIDYLLVNSRIDNSPNVILEAKSLGIPVIATDVGGISEQLNLEEDILVPEAANNPISLFDLLSGLNSDSRKPFRFRQSDKNTWTQYKSFYEKFGINSS